MMNGDMLSRMKKDAILLNIGRGTLVDTEALISALRNGDLGAYITDVTDPEPLPSDSPLWDCPNVYITPHISGNYHLHDTYERVNRGAQSESLPCRRKAAQCRGPGDRVQEI